jgi:hypothetical protein
LPALPVFLLRLLRLLLLLLQKVNGAQCQSFFAGPAGGFVSAASGPFPAVFARTLSFFFWRPLASIPGRSADFPAAAQTPGRSCCAHRITPHTSSCCANACVFLHVHTSKRRARASFSPMVVCVSLCLAALRLCVPPLHTAPPLHTTEASQ